jgi:predicted dehydrogenase
MFKIIHVGAGAFGRHWMSTLAAHSIVEIVAVVDPSTEALNTIKELLPDPSIPTFTSLDEALTKIKADAAFIITPPETHQPLASLAFQYGLHVLTEKPLAPTDEACLKMIEDAKQAGKTLMVSQNYRYQPVFATLKAQLDQGVIGAVGQVSIQFFKGPHFGGFRDEMPFPLIIDMAIHHFDLIRYLFDDDMKSLIAESWNPSWSWYKGEASTSIHFCSKKQIHIHYLGSWCSTGAETSWNANWIIEGDKGVLEVNDDQIFLSLTNEQRQSIPLEPLQREGLEANLYEFVESIQENRLPKTHGEDNYQSIRMVFGALESIRKDEKIQFK